MQISHQNLQMNISIDLTRTFHFRQEVVIMPQQKLDKKSYAERGWKYVIKALVIYFQCGVLSL